MVKSFKKAIAILVSVLMIATSLPFTALAAENDGLNAAINAYETKMNGTIYNNMKAAYDAYVTACYAKEALSVGDTTTYDIATVTSNLTKATNAMTAWSAYTGNANQSISSGAFTINDDSTDQQYVDTFKNILYTNKGIDDAPVLTTAEYSWGGINKREVLWNTYYEVFGKMRFYMPKDITVLYDGITAPKFGVMINFFDCRINRSSTDQYRFYAARFTSDLNMETKWHGTDTRPNFMFLRYSKGEVDARSADTTSNYHQNCNNQYYANIATYNNSDFSDIMKEVKPSIKVRNGFDLTNTETEFLPNVTIRILNYKKVVDTLNSKKTTISQVANYKQGGLSNVMAGIDRATVNPNSYFTSANNYSTCKDNYSNAVTLMTSAATADTMYTVTVSGNPYTLSKGAKASTVQYLMSVNTPSKAPDANYHYSYSWTTAADVTANASYNAIENATAHTMVNNGDATAATCDADGSQPTKCTGCDYTSATTLTKLGHNYTTYTKTYGDDVEFDETASYQHTANCTNDCGTADTKNCTFGAWTEAEEGKQVKTCTVCGGQVYQIVEAGQVTLTFKLPNGTVVKSETVDADSEVTAPSLDAYAYNNAAGHHTYSWAQATYTATEDTDIVAIENEVANHSTSTKNDTFVNVDEETLLATSCDESKTYSYDVVEYCTECDVEISRETENVDPLAHTNTVFAYKDTDNHDVKCDVCKATTSTEEHNYTPSVTPASCTAQGYTTYTCDDCNYSYNTDYTELEDHDFGSYTTVNDIHTRVCAECTFEESAACSKERQIVPATCTEDAKSAYVCSVCKNASAPESVYGVELSNFTDVKEEAVGSRIDNKNYNGSLVGSHQYINYHGNFGVKNYTLNFPFEVDKVVLRVYCHTHENDGSWINVLDDDGNLLQRFNKDSSTGSARDIVVTGYDTNYIQFNSELKSTQDFLVVDSVVVYPKAYKAKGHDMQDVPGTAIATTCTVDGRSADKACSRCDATETGTTITAPGHSFKNYVSNNDATCQKNATQTATCDNCDATDTKDIDNSTVAHSYELTDTVEAGHTENGKNVYTCKWCDDTYEEPIYAAGHTAGAAVIEDAVNVDANGVATSCDPTLEYSYNLVTRCTECTEIMTSVPTTVDPLAHTEVTDDAVVADCITEGLTEGKHCSVCETVIVAQTNIGKDATKHVGTVTLDESTVVEATEETAGYTGDKICDACNEVAEAGQEIPALGYTITFNGKTKVTQNFPVNTPAADVYAWAVANVESKAPTSTSHYYWKEASFVDVTAAKSYSMTSYNHYNDLVITYDGDEETGVKINRTCETCGYTDQLDAVAKVGDKYFSAIKAATDACTSADDVVTIITDVTTASSNAITNSCTIDLNGKTITMTGSGAVFNITFNSSADPTVPTKVTFVDSVGTANVVATNATSGMGISVAKPNVDVQINGGNYQSVTEAVYVYPQYKKSLKYYDITGAIITVNDGTFASSASSKLTLNLNDNARVDNGFIVNGGTYKNFNPLGNVEITVSDGKLVDDSVAGQTTVVDGTDYIAALNAAKTTADAVNPAEWTDESYAALVTAKNVTPARTTTAYDAATAAILTAIDELVKKDDKFTVTVNVEVDGEPVDKTILKAVYGESVTVDVTSILDGASIQKWTIEQAEATSKLSMASPVYEMVVTDNVTINVYATNADAEATSKIKVTFIDRTTKVIGFGYVENETDVMVGQMTPVADSKIVAPSIAFYDFAGWEKVAQNKYMATYNVSVDTCNANVQAGSDNILVNNEQQITAYYDELVNITYAGDKALGMLVNGEVMPITDVNNVHVPYGTDVVKIVELDYEPGVTTMVTGKYFRSEGSDKVAGFNCMYYLPEGCTLVECGVLVSKGDTFDESTALKVRSQSQSLNNEYTVGLRGTFVSTVITGASYVTYRDAFGNVSTVVGTPVSQSTVL